MFEHLTTPDDLLTFRLGSLLNAEKDSLDMLEELARATSERIRPLFAEHAEETRRQITNVERCLELVGSPEDASPSPTTAGLAKEAHSLLRKTDDALHDDVALSAALETEHHEIATYSSLLVLADGPDKADLRDLLAANLAEEVGAADKIVTALRAAHGQS
ncbi:ferritin-like domain-containing protein [Luteimicrobium sp. DT211]|uniref:YciE/YciF ferroxidase family protein n=1 Tax=Luteimicrobium sp. DT211 TaxID=3393412 RepID=UPI003CEBCFBC